MKAWRRDYTMFLARKCGACCNDFRKKARVIIHVAAAMIIVIDNVQYQLLG